MGGGDGNCAPSGNSWGTQENRDLRTYNSVLGKRSCGGTWMSLKKSVDTTSCFSNSLFELRREAERLLLPTNL